MIHHRLRNDRHRYILVSKKSKKPVDTGWTTKNQHRHDSPTLLKHIEAGGNYGIATGNGDLCAVDYDQLQTQKELSKKLPPTFVVKSGSGLEHHYYYVKDAESFKILDDKKDTVLDFQAKGKQLIGPGSTHPNGNKYTVTKDIPIAEIPFSKLKAIFSSHFPPDWQPKSWNTKTLEYAAKTSSDEGIQAIKNNIPIVDYLDELGIDTKKNPTGCPLHSSKGGKCLSFNAKLDLWKCFHCEEGGDLITLYRLVNRTNFIKAKTELALKAKVDLDKYQTSTASMRIDNYQQNAQTFWDQQPFFYSKEQQFWFWNFNKMMYEVRDDVDVMTLIDNALNFYGATVTSGLRNNYLEALRRVGRSHYPQEAPPNWIQFNNRIVDINSGEVFDPSPDYFLTNPIPHDLSKSSATPVLDKLFESWVGKEMVPTLYEIIAYCTYPSYKQAVIFGLIGGGANGKSKFLAVLERFIGKENTVASSLEILSTNRFEAYNLYRKLACIMGETGFDQLERSDLMKSLCAGDSIRYEIKHKGTFTARNYAKIIIASNSLPTSADDSYGWYRRWMIVNFPNTFTDKIDILDTIPDEEYTNLTRKVVEVLPKILERESFTGQGDADEREKAYLSASNPLPDFIDKHCDIGHDNFVSYGHLYTIYKIFLRENKRRRVSRREFKESLEAEGYTPEKTSKKIGELNGASIYKSTYWVEGLCIKPGDFYARYAK